GADQTVFDGVVVTRGLLAIKSSLMKLLFQRVLLPVLGGLVVEIDATGLLAFLLPGALCLLGRELALDGPVGSVGRAQEENDEENDRYRRQEDDAHQHPFTGKQEGRELFHSSDLEIDHAVHDVIADRHQHERGADADPPPLNGSTLKYGFDHEGGPRWQTSDTSPTRLSRNFGRLKFCAARGWRWRMRFARSAFRS